MLYSEYVNCRRQYQEQGAQLLLEKKHACLFFEPGKGKTFPVIDALKYLESKNPELQVLILSSADAIKKMWKAEIVPQHILPKNTYMATSTKAIQDKTSIALLAHKWDVVIVDECHIVKARNSKIHKLVRKLCKYAEYAWGLTGTPRGNSDIDMWCQFQALNVNKQGNFSYSAWTKMCCEFEVGYSAYGRFETPTQIKQEWKPWWDELLDTYCLFVDYDEDDDMPNLDIQVLEIPFVKTKEYQDALNGIIEVGDFATTMQKMVAITKAHQVANGFIYIPNEKNDTREVHKFRDNDKLNYLDKYTDKSKCVIVYKYAEDYEQLNKKFGKRATNEVLDFKTGKYDVLLLQCNNCKSFNLQDNCDTILFYTMDYSFIKYKQMIHRCWRLGQKRDTKIVIMQYKDSIEKDIWNAVKDKQKVHNLYMSIKSGIRGE